MPDIFTRRKRSNVVSRIHGAGNKDAELRLIQIFRTSGITGWRRGSKLPDRPSFVFPKLKTAVLVDGCFWHGCPRHFIQPKGNAAFWWKKIQTNRARDRKVNRSLRSMGWKVARVWEHELKRRDEPQLVRRLMRILGQSA